MLPSWWPRFRSAFKSARPVARPKLALETLEAREVPAASLVSTAHASFMSPSASANGQSEITPRNSISDDGRYLVFSSTAYNLVEGQTRFNSTTTTQNVYLYDTTTSVVTLVSHNGTTATQNGNAASFNPVISADGTTVAFFSLATDLSNSYTITDGTVQLYLYDVSDGDLTLVSHSLSSATTGAGATNPFIPDTPANDYGAVNTLGYYAGVADFFGSQIVGGGLGLPSLSADGSYVAYISNAGNLADVSIPSDIFGNVTTQAFLYERATNTNTLISHLASSASTGADGYASTVSISRDGTTVAFTSPATDITSATTDGVNDQLYIYSRTNNTDTGLSAGQIVLASHAAGDTATGTTINSGSYAYGFTADNPPTLSDNGRYVAYYHAGEDLVTSQGGTASVLNVFRYDVLNNTNRLVSHTGDGATAGDNPENRIAPLGVGPAEATGPQISGDGRYIAYANNSSNLLPGSPFSSYDGRDQVYLFDANASNSSANKLVSHADGSLTTPSATGGTAPSMTADGRFVAYIDWAYPSGDSDNPIPAVAAGARLYDRDATGTDLPQLLGVVYDTDSGNASGSLGDAEFNAAILVPTVMNRAGGVVVWNGNVVFDVPGPTTPNDTNSAIDVFIATNTPPAPTELNISTLDVPALSETTFAQFTTTADGTGRVFQYTLEPGTGDTHNAQFVVENDTLKTGTNFAQYALDNAGPYSILARTTDANFPTVFLNQQFTLNVITAPTDLALAPPRFVNDAAGTTISQFTTDGLSGRTFQYTLVNGTGGTDNGKFTISGDALKLGSGFPLSGTQTTFNIRVRTADSAFSGLFYEESFTITLVVPPTNITANVSEVPALPNTTFAQFTTAGDGGSTYTYQLVTGTGDTHNGLFTVSNSGAITTATSGFPATGVTQYSVRVRATDADFPTLTIDKVLTFTVVNGPTDIAISGSTFSASAGATVGTLSVPGSGRAYTYQFVTGFDEGFFVLNGSTLSTDTDFPAGVADTYQVRVRVTDPTFGGLTYQETITVTAVLQPADPNLSVPSQLQAVESQTFAVNVTASPGDTTSAVTVTISNVPVGVTFSAGTNNLDGSWTFTQAQLAGLTMTVPDDATFVLDVEATAELTGGGGLTSSVSDSIPVAVANAAPTFSVSNPGQFNPLNGAVSIGVSTGDVGTDAVQFITVNWGDGTVEQFAAARGTFAHQYAVADRTYQITVTATDEDGDFVLPGGVQLDAELPTQQQSVVAELYLDLLGRSADAGGLTEFSGALAAGVPISVVVNAMVNSNEYRAKVVNDLYRKYLGRDADAGGLAGYVQFLAAGGTVNQIAASILGSAEFFDKAGGTNEGFVNALYLAVLGRPVDTAGAANLGPLSFGVTREQIAFNILSSTEAAQEAVEDAYELYLGRPADAGAPGWVALYQSDPAAFLVSFLSTPEFSNNLAAV